MQAGESADVAEEGFDVVVADDVVVVLLGIVGNLVADGVDAVILEDELEDGI